MTEVFEKVQIATFSKFSFTMTKMSLQAIFNIIIHMHHLKAPPIIYSEF